MSKNLTEQERKQKVNSLIKTNEESSVEYDDSILRFVLRPREIIFLKDAEYIK